MPTTEKTPPAKFAVSLGPELGSKTFKNLEEVQAWLNKEQGFWQPIASVAGDTQATRTAWQPYHAFFDSLSHVFSDLANAKQHEENARTAAARMPAQAAQILAQGQVDLDQFVARIKGAFSEHPGAGRVFLSGSPRAKYCTQLVQAQSPVVALFAAAFFLRVEVPFVSCDAMSGAFAAYSFEHGLTPATPAETESLSGLRSEWNSLFQSLKEKLEKQTTLQAEMNANLGQQIIAQASEFKDITDKEKAGWVALHKQYDASLALRKPVSFWDKKARSHCILAWIFGPVSLIAAGAVFALIYQLIQITLRPPANLANPANWHPEYWRIAVLVASGVFSVWVIRIFVRLFLSHVHLHSDARERVTMALTYLSLLRSDKTLQAKERDLILHALFRQAATGVVKDDAIPLAAVEYLTRTSK